MWVYSRFSAPWNFSNVNLHSFPTRRSSDLGSALGALGTAVVLGVELALVEPRLAELIAWRNGGYSIPGAPAELFAISLVDRESTRLNFSHSQIAYVVCFSKKQKKGDLDDRE